MFDKRYLMSRQEQNNLFLIKIKRKKFCNESSEFLKEAEKKAFERQEEKISQYTGVRTLNSFRQLEVTGSV